jgi:hypothetical protein
MVNNLMETTTTTGKGASRSRTSAFAFEAVDVTATRSVNARGVQRSTPAGSVARALAVKMDLPRNVPWTLRNDRTGAILDDESPIGEQIEPGSKVVVTPKSHLGGVQ